MPEYELPEPHLASSDEECDTASEYGDDSDDQGSDDEWYTIMIWTCVIVLILQEVYFPIVSKKGIQIWWNIS